VKPIHQKISDEGKCRCCGVPDSIHGLDPAHTIPKSLSGKNTYDSVLPLCRACHDAQHRGEIELLPLMTRDEQVEAVRAVGLARAYRYLTRTEADNSKEER
jgi:5-methylcytosine-specific restriction endonuclease McrA